MIGDLQRNMLKFLIFLPLTIVVFSSTQGRRSFFTWGAKFKKGTFFVKKALPTKPNFASYAAI